jgi:hypothetical protein
MPLAWASKNIAVHVESIQYVDIPTYDKISDIEHKNGKRLVNTREKNDETHEIKR